VPILVKKLLKEEDKTVGERVTEFLKRNKRYAYTTKELAQKLKANKFTVRSALKKLVKKGKLKVKKYEGKSYYYFP